MAHAIFTGNWPAMVTPMYDDGRIRSESVAPLVEKFVAEGAGGIYLCGSTGQGPLLTVDERKAIAAEAVRAAAGRLPVMVHVGSIRIDDAVELARHAAEVGADAVSSVPPIYYPLTFAATMEQFRRIAGATDLPFYAYNFAIPDCSVEQYVDGLTSLPTARGLKFTSVNMYELARLRIAGGCRLNVLSGSDESYLAAQSQGADGAIGSTQNIGLPLFDAVTDAARAGEWEEARSRMLTVVRLVQEVTIQCGIASLHGILSREGIPCGQPRHPLPSASPATFDRAWEAYQRLRAEA